MISIHVIISRTCPCMKISLAERTFVFASVATELSTTSYKLHLAINCVNYPPRYITFVRRERIRAQQYKRDSGESPGCRPGLQGTARPRSLISLESRVESLISSRCFAFVLFSLAASSYSYSSFISSSSCISRLSLRS